LCGKTARRDLRGGRPVTGVPTLMKKTQMRLALPDLLFAIASFGMGTGVCRLLGTESGSLHQICGGMFLGLIIYLVLIYPVYRGFKLFPMILPRCPCCGNFQQGFHVRGDDWPRISFRCPTCSGEFVVWHNGKPSPDESWDHPVLALKWPYALGRYKRMKLELAGY
jgi:hypothetical protein